MTVHIRKQLVSAQAYIDRIREYKAILEFVKYELKNNMMVVMEWDHIAFNMEFSVVTTNWTTANSVQIVTNC